MKKSTCKLTSMVLTLMFLLSLLCVNVAKAEGGYTVSDSEVTRIEGENYTSVTVTPQIRKMNTGDDVTKAVSYAYFQPTDYEGQDFIVAYTVNVSVPGNYGISAVASKRSETYTSDWTVYANTEDNAVSVFTKTVSEFTILR